MPAGIRSNVDRDDRLDYKPSLPGLLGTGATRRRTRKSTDSNTLAGATAVMAEPAQLAWRTDARLWPTLAQLTWSDTSAVASLAAEARRPDVV